MTDIRVTGPNANEELGLVIVALVLERGGSFTIDRSWLDAAMASAGHLEIFRLENGDVRVLLLGLESAYEDGESVDN